MFYSEVVSKACCLYQLNANRSSRSVVGKQKEDQVKSIFY